MKKHDHLPTFRKKKAHKKALRGLLICSPVMALFCLVLAVSIVSQYENSREIEEHGSSGVIIQAGQQAESEEQYIQNESTTDSDVKTVDDSIEIYVTPKMTYTLETYDVRDGQMTSEILPIPNEMYGLNRTELETYLVQLAASENQNSMDTEYYYHVTLFSRRAFTVRKTIVEKKPRYAIFLIAEEGWLTAYTGDRTSIYEELHIALGDFPLEQQAMLTQGIYMKTMADYYDFLETYSS